LAAGGPVTFVATKVTKKASAERLLCRTGPLLCKSDRTTDCNYFALLRSLVSRASAKTCYVPTAAQATIVLSDFARSLSADGGEDLFYQQLKKSW